MNASISDDPAWVWIVLVVFLLFVTLPMWIALRDPAEDRVLWWSVAGIIAAFIGVSGLFAVGVIV